MRIGRLDRRVRVEHLVVTGKDPEFNTDVKGWATLIPILWVSVVDPKPGNVEAERMGMDLSRPVTLVKYRYRIDITNKMRFVEISHRKRTLNIVGGPSELDYTGRYRVLTAMCEAAQ